MRLSRRCEGWVERVAEVYRLNDERLEHYDPALERQRPEFDAAQGALKKAVDCLSSDAEAELAGLSDKASRAKPLRSLVNHREGLSVFVDNPRFLILPWITIPNLGSHILAPVRRRLPGDWVERYNTLPCSSMPSSRPRATPAPSTRLPVGSVSARPRDAGATTRA